LRALPNRQISNEVDKDLDDSSGDASDSHVGNEDMDGTVDAIKSQEGIE